MPRPARNAPPSSLRPVWIDRASPAPEQIYRALRAAIVSLEISPGSQLSEGEVAQVYSVSRTPVREAFSRLAEERLLDVFPNLGTFASLIDRFAVAEASLMRRLLEGEAAASAARRRPADLLAEMKAALVEHEAAVACRDAAQAYVCDERFHRALFLGQRLEQMWASVDRARAQLDRVHHLMVTQNGALEDALAKHAAILAAIESGREDTARAAMTAHIDANAAFLASLADRSHPFVRPA